MAVTINSRQLELDGSTVRDTTTDVIIASTGSEFLTQLDSSVLPNAITLSTTLTNLTAPVVYEWRYSNSVDPTVWNLITGQTGDNLVVTKENFATYLSTGTYVKFKVAVSKIGFIGSEDTYTIYQTKESDQVVQVLVNTPNILISADSDGSVTDFSNTDTEVRVLINGKALTYATTGPNTFSVGTLTQAPLASITLGASSTTATTYNLANISALTQDSAALTIPVTIRNSQGTAKPVINYVQKYYKIKPGQSSVSCILTNDTHSVPTDAQGNNPIYAGSGTQIFVYDGLQELVYDGVGTTDGKWKVTAVGNNITPGSPSIQGNNAVISNASLITNDTASITFTITGKTFSGVAFTFSKTQTFSKSKSGTNPIIYLINTTSPVITKQAPNAVTSGTHSSVTIRGKKYEGNLETNYGWITVTANGDTEQFPAIDTATTPYVLQPAVGAGKTSYTIRLYNQAAQSGSTLLDTEVLDVIFKGEASARFSIDNAGATFVKDAAGVLAPANIVLTTSSSNFTGITYQWQKNGVNISGATSSSYTVPSSDYNSVNTNTYKCNATGTINGVAGQTLSDTITIPRLDYGSSAPTVVLSNENSTFPAGLSGYTGITFTGGSCNITAYLGTTQLTYAATGANTFTVSGHTSVGATVAAGAGAGVTYSVPEPTAMSADTAYTDVTVVIRDAAGVALPSITRRISYSLARTGATGASAVRFSIDNAASTFVKDSAGALAPANIVLTTSSSNFTGISYQWQKNGVNISGATSSSYTVPSSDYSSVNTNTYKCNATGTINGVAGQTLSDTITIPRLDYGSSSPTVVLSNENSTFPAGLSGYTGITFTGGNCDITAYLGTTQLSYAATGANTFSVSAQTSTGATVAAGTGSGVTYSVSAPTAMSAETAYTDVTVVIRDAAGSALSSITRRINYSLARTGATGAAAARFSIDNAASTFVKDSAGALSPANIVLTTSSSNFTGITYQWQKNGVNISGATSSSYTVPSSDYSSVNTNTYKCNATGTINGVAGQTLSDTITIPRLDYGSSSPTVVLSNENSTFPAGLSGYTGITFTGGNCDITAYLGTTQLTYAATGANTFTVSAQTSTGATVATGTGSGVTYAVPAPSAMSAETGYTDVTVIIRDAAGTALPSMTRRINYSLARTGATGASAARFSIDNASSTFVKDSAGTLSPANIVLTTSSSNFTGITYQWQKNGVNISGATNSSYTVPSSDYSSVNTNTYKCNATGTINGVAGQTLSDTITIPRLDYGSSAPTVVLSNENTTFPAALSGYAGITFTGGNCDITAYLGTTQLTYATTGANTFNVSAQASTGATVATGTGSGVTYSVPAPTGMSAETAYTDVTVVIRDAAGTALSSITRRISYSLARTGSTGASAARFSIDNAASTFVKDAAGALAPANIVLTTSSSNFTGISYQWQKNGVNISGATNSSYTVPSSDYSSVNTNTYKCNATGTINGVAGQTLSDTITIPRLDYGSSSPTVVLSNENATFPGPLSGYAGITFTGGNCDITAYLGSTQLSYATTGANTFNVSAQASTGATVATGTGSGVTYSVPAPTGMSAETAYTDVTVVIRDAAGTALSSITRRISYSIARTGATGSKNITLSCFLWSNTNITTAPTQAANLNWSTLLPDAYPTSPGTWTAAPIAAPGNGFTLYQLNVVVTAAGAATSTPFNWNTGSIGRIGYRQDGSVGLTGNSARTAYIVTTSNSPPTTITADTGDNPPTGGWTFTATSNLTAGQYMYQVDGLYNPNTNAITWGNAYLSNLKVGQLSAIAADLGSITAGSININSGQATISSLGAADFRAITIRDSNGTVLLQSGGNIDFSRVAGTTKPDNNATANAVGSGTFANRPVGNNGDFYFATDNNTLYQKISGNWVQSANNYTNTNQLTDGANLGGTAAWTGVSSRPANLSALTGTETIRNNLINVDATGNINGIGTGDGVSVANNQDNIIRAPGGGIYTTQTSAVSGALKIRLPQFFTDTMMRFAVEIYEYSSGFMCTLEIGGYNYSSNNTWYNVTARVIGTSNVEYPVRFGHDGTKCCIWVGNNNESWSYPQVRIRDFFAGYNNVAKNLWESGWVLSFDTATATNVTATVLDTLPGADWSKTSNKPTSLSGINSTEGTKLSGIEAGATVGATWGTNLANQPSSLSGINSTEGTKLTGIEAGATVGATAGSNLKDSNGRTISDKRLLGNLLDSTTWVLGSSGSQTGFGQNSTSSTGLNYIEPNTLPDGSQGLVWVAKAGNAAGTSAEGGWNSTDFNIDHTKMYRFSVWIRLAGDGSTGSYYLGVGGSTVRDIGGTTNGNPYFIAQGRSALTPGIWYLVLGYVFPSGYTGIQYNLGGTYRATDGVRIAASTDYRWVVGQTSSYHRTYQYYTNSASSYQLFWNPRVELIDGSEPSVAELLAMGAISGRNKIDSTNNGNFIADDGIPGAKVSSIRVGTISNSVNGNKLTGGRVDIDAPVDGNGNSLGGRIRIYDGSGLLRLKIGYLV